MESTYTQLASERHVAKKMTVCEIKTIKSNAMLSTDSNSNIAFKDRGNILKPNVQFKSEFIKE